MQLGWFLAAVIAVSQACGVTAANSLYIYQQNSYPIREYMGTENDFTKSTAPKIVEFYSPHCPACISFKPEYIKIAKELLKTYPQRNTEFYAVSCVAQPRICNELVIDTTPSLYVYPPGATKGKRLKRDAETKLYSAPQFAKALELDSGTGGEAVPARRMDDGPSFMGETDAAETDGDEEEDDDTNGEEEGGNNDGKEEDDDETTGKGDGDEGDEQDEDESANRAIANAVGGGATEEKEEDTEEGDDETGTVAAEEDDNPAAPGDDGENAHTNEGNGAQGAAGDENGDSDEGSDKDSTQASTTEEEESEEGDGQYQPPPGGLPGPEWKPGPAGLPQLGGGAVQRNPHAGHDIARNQQKALDRFREDMKMQMIEYEKKRAGLGKFVRRDNRKDRQGRNKMRHDSHAMTDGMKAFTPGTDLHKKRETLMKQRLQKAHTKMRIPSQITEKTPLTKESLPYKKDVRKQGFVKKAAAFIPLVGRRFRMTPEEELILDVSLSLVVGFESGIKFKGNDGLSGKQQQALLNFLDLLNVALPPEWGIHELINDMRRRFAYIVQSDENMKRILDNHPLPQRMWSKSCVQLKKGTMGFSCGFWKLLHVTTVGVAEQQGGLNLVESGLVGPGTKLFSPIDAADAIRDYIEEFFNCEPCRKEFVENYDDCENNRRCDRLSEEIEEASTPDWKELPVWLWEVHNEVSVRILKEKELREKRLGIAPTAGKRKLFSSEISVIWPNIETCFLCFHEDGTWDESEVFKHLESTYWPDSDMDPKSERLIQYQDDGSLGFGVFLWIIMFAVLGIVYSTIGEISPASFRQGMYQAKRMVTVGPGGKKMRSN